MIPSLASAILHTEILVSAASHKLTVCVSLFLLYLTAPRPIQNPAPVNPNLLQLRHMEMERVVSKQACCICWWGQETPCSCQHREREAGLGAVMFGMESREIYLTSLPSLADEGLSIVSGCHTDVHYPGSSFWSEKIFSHRKSLNLFSLGWCYVLNYNTNTGMHICTNSYYICIRLAYGTA